MTTGKRLDLDTPAPAPAPSVVIGPNSSAANDVLNLGSSVESGVAVQNKIDTRFLGGTNQPDNFDNYHFFFLFLKIIRKYYLRSIIFLI